MRFHFTILNVSSQFKVPVTSNAGCFQNLQICGFQSQTGGVTSEARVLCEKDRLVSESLRERKLRNIYIHSTISEVGIARHFKALTSRVILWSSDELIAGEAHISSQVTGELVWF